MWTVFYPLVHFAFSNMLPRAQMTSWPPRCPPNSEPHRFPQLIRIIVCLLHSSLHTLKNDTTIIDALHAKIILIWVEMVDLYGTG